MKKLTLALAELAGLASVITGVALMHPPSAFIVAGAAVVGAVTVREVRQ